MGCQKSANSGPGCGFELSPFDECSLSVVAIAIFLTLSQLPALPVDGLATGIAPQHLRRLTEGTQKCTPHMVAITEPCLARNKVDESSSGTAGERTELERRIACRHGVSLERARHGH